MTAPDEVLGALGTDATTGFYKTLNGMGGMTPVLDAFGEAFVAFAPVAPGPVLDVGAAFGIASVAALAGGATVIANDLEPRHLEILASRVRECDQARLSLRPGAFPDALDFTPGSLGAVMLGRMLHFLDGPAIARGAAKLHGWLAPGGKVFGVAVTPYLVKLQPFRPLYEARRAAGDPWPGWIEDIRAYDPASVGDLPVAMNFLDPEVVTRCFGEAGFIVERAEYLSRQAFVADMKLDGREAVGFVVTKPA